MTTYAELVTQIRDYSETDDQVLTTTIINDIIANAEDNIFRSVELDCFKEYISGNTAANNRFVLLPGQTTSATTPTISDLATIRYVTLYTNSGTKERSELVRVDVDFLNEQTHGWEELVEKILPKYTLEEAEKVTGVKASEIEKLAIEYAKTKKSYIIYKSGKGFDLYTDFSKKIVLNDRNVFRFLNQVKIFCKV